MPEKEVTKVPEGATPSSDKKKPVVFLESDDNLKTIRMGFNPDIDQEAVQHVYNTVKGALNIPVS